MPMQKKRIDFEFMRRKSLTSIPARKYVVNLVFVNANVSLVSKRWSRV